MTLILTLFFGVPIRSPDCGRLSEHRCISRVIYAKFHFSCFMLHFLETSVYIHCETFETVEHDRQILIVGVVVYGAYEKSKKKKRVENLPLRRDDDWFQRDSQLRKHNTIRSIIFSLAGGRRGVSTEEGITAFTGKELAAPEETAVTKIRIDKKKKNARSA